MLPPGVPPVGLGDAELEDDEEEDLLEDDEVQELPTLGKVKLGKAGLPEVVVLEDSP